MRGVALSGPELVVLIVTLSVAGSIGFAVLLGLFLRGASRGYPPVPDPPAPSPVAGGLVDAETALTYAAAHPVGTPPGRVPPYRCETCGAELDAPGFYVLTPERQAIDLCNASCLKGWLATEVAGVIESTTLRPHHTTKGDPYEELVLEAHLVTTPGPFHEDVRQHDGLPPHQHAMVLPHPDL